MTTNEPVETKTFWLPIKIFACQTPGCETSTPCSFEQVLLTLEIEATGEWNVQNTARQVLIPSDWKLQMSEESAWQYHLVNGAGTLLLKFFFKQNGWLAMQLMVPPQLPPHVC